MVIPIASLSAPAHPLDYLNGKFHMMKLSSRAVPDASLRFAVSTSLLLK